MPPFKSPLNVTGGMWLELVNWIFYGMFCKIYTGVVAEWKLVPVNLQFVLLKTFMWLTMRLQILVICWWESLFRYFANEHTNWKVKTGQSTSFVCRGVRNHNTSAVIASYCYCQSQVTRANYMLTRRLWLDVSMPIYGFIRKITFFSL